ncbi:MAG: hypothetical protein JST21_00335 [Bacteroidetes bacterium]|nr:hypothetical protein [Bacteroidota bacterium]MBS1744592.1 hypothetical protein [Bacteroidota bacterium]
MRKIFLLIVSTNLIFSCNEEAKQPSTPSQDTIQAMTDTKATVESDTVNNPRLVKAETDGSILLTAENGKAVGPEIKYMPEWRAFGWFTANDKVEWEVETDKPKEYEVYLEWSVSDEEAGKEFIIETKDGQLTGIVKPSGSWETYKNEKIGKINLSEGLQKIVFKSKTKFEKGGLLDLRQIKLVAGK